MNRELVLNVNGREHRITVKTHHTLLQVLRDQLELFDVREGCGVGMCGSCTVLIDGQPMCSCLIFTSQVEDRSIQTVEGLSRNGELHPIQQAYAESTGFQCSFCTPGFILTTKALLEEMPDASDSEIREYLAGNLCRCGSYNKILDAVKLARERLHLTGHEPE
jgi:aerobic-type carbon monoxide dehydrogenase small subunit (CoxS/CutS family)